MTRQGAPYAPYARPQGSVRLQDPAAAGGGLPGRAGLPGPRPAAELPADARTPPPHGGSRPAALRRRAGQPGGLGALDPELAGPRLLGAGPSAPAGPRRYRAQADLRLRTGPRTEPAAAHCDPGSRRGMPGGDRRRLARRALRRHLAADALPGFAALPGEQPLRPHPAVRRRPSGASRQPALAGAPTRLRTPAHGLAATGLRHAPGAAARCARAEPLPCRRAARERSAGGASGPSAPRSLPAAAGPGAPHRRPVHPAQGPVAPCGHPRPVVGRELCRTGRLAGA